MSQSTNLETHPAETCTVDEAQICEYYCDGLVLSLIAQYEACQVHYDESLYCALTMSCLSYVPL